MYQASLVSAVIIYMVTCNGLVQCHQFETLKLSDCLQFVINYRYKNFVRISLVVSLHLSWLKIK
ncbi:hypothetical protein TSAR_004991 [Trichomalopsis sarcophagae]|uniref:Uncharacterized protein n=1 Tax=Trichomalopsis sarcophagae TaxID=543379 RepID=A0A232EE91_9HYME|nr:hypothetical protein TSAR_004991 [Trichomalopsis sarcophagae]